jgi:hypothetical protein
MEEASWEEDRVEMNEGSYIDGRMRRRIRKLLATVEEGRDRG